MAMRPFSSPEWLQLQTPPNRKPRGRSRGN
jgi:hypothetical protein